MDKNKFFIFLVLLVFLSGCHFMRLDLEGKNNPDLNTYIYKRGIPINIEVIRIDPDVYQVLFYRQYPDDDSFNPVVFKNGRFDNWGMSYYYKLKNSLKIK